MMTGVTRYHLEMAIVGLQLSSWYSQLTSTSGIVKENLNASKPSDHPIKQSV